MSVRVSLSETRAAAPGCLAFSPAQSSFHFIRNLLRPPRNPRESHAMNYPLLPADAAAYAWQLSCCLVTLLFALFSWMVGPR